MRLTTIIPAYNAAAFIAETLESVLDQTVVPDEILVIDDGSTDDTGDVVDQFGAPVRLVRQSNAGVSAARNAGIARAGGEFVAFLDADDLWLPDKIEKQLAFLDRHPDAVYLIANECYFTDRDGVTVPSYLATVPFADELPQHPHIFEKPLTRLLTDGFVSTSSVVVRARYFAQTGGFDETLSLVEDRDMWLKLAELGPVCLMPDVLVRKRQEHGANLANAPTLYWARCLEQVIGRHEPLVWDRLPAEGTDPRALFADHYARLGRLYWHNSHFADARRCLGRSIRLGRRDGIPRWLACLFGAPVLGALRGGG